MAHETPGRAAIYTRISNDAEGRKVGVKRQERLCREKAQGLGAEVVAVFSDNDISASVRSKKKRPDYEAMLSRARAGEFTHILAYSSSRLTRRLSEFLGIIALHDERGVELHMVNTDKYQYDLSTAQGRGDAQRAASYDEQEAAITAERVKAAAADRAARGEFHGGFPPFGYRREVITVLEADPDYDDGDEDAPEPVERKRSLLVHEPDEVELIKHASTRLLDYDDTLYSIIKDWNTRGVATRQGNAWRHSTLRSALTNRALLGETKAAAQGWEPILDEVTFRRLRDKLVNPVRIGGNPLGAKSSKYALGGGLTVCGRCGKPLTAISRSEKGNPPIVKLVCRAFMNGDDPNHPEGEPQLQKGKLVKTSTGRVVIRHDLWED